MEIPSRSGPATRARSGSLARASLVAVIAIGASTALGASAASDSDGYVGTDECLTCHDDVASHFAKTVHARVFAPGNARTPAMERGCESCHGPGESHVDAEGRGGRIVAFSSATPESVEAGKAACLSCHERGARIHWKGSAHDWRDLSCTSCHTVMRNESARFLLARPTVDETCQSCHLVRRAQSFRNAHMPLREGVLSCTSCHAPHGSTSLALLKSDSVNDTCYECHADKRGPFLWEHAPVTEDCSNCHAPHGSTRANMLKLNPPRLCQQCHIETRHPTEARLPQAKFVIGRACNQCHVNIHGSNHPSGHAFTR